MSTTTDDDFTDYETPACEHVFDRLLLAIMGQLEGDVAGCPRRLAAIAADRIRAAHAVRVGRGDHFEDLPEFDSDLRALVLSRIHVLTH